MSKPPETTKPGEADNRLELKNSHVFSKTCCFSIIGKRARSIFFLGLGTGPVVFWGFMFNCRGWGGVGGWGYLQPFATLTQIHQPLINSGVFRVFPSRSGLVLHMSPGENPPMNQLVG